MAIEDEIINIADIDKGTDILKDDKLIIETNNGTKLLDFKDLIINEDQITFADKLIQRSGDLTDSDTYVNTVTGYNILTTNTTPGHVTTYSDISGTVELGTRMTEVESKVVDAGVSLTPSTSAVNFKVTNNANVQVNTAAATKYWAEFDTINLNPTSTHSGVTFQSAEGTPFKLVYPSSSFTAGWYLFTGTLEPKLNPSATDSYGLKQSDWIKLFIKTSSGGVTEIQPQRQNVVAFGTAREVSFNTVQYINPGDTIYIKSNKRFYYMKGSNFSGVRIVS